MTKGQLRQQQLVFPPFSTRLIRYADRTRVHASFRTRKEENKPIKKKDKSPDSTSAARPYPSRMPINSYDLLPLASAIH